jgi:hypothetical protein
MTRYIPIASVVAAFIVLLTIAGLTKPAASQGGGVQELPVKAVCTRSDQLGFLMGTNAPKRTPIMIDDDGDGWLILENEATDLKVIGFESPANRVFCGIGAKGAKRAAPQRGV